MGPDPIQELIRENQHLEPGMDVTVHWSEGGFDYRGRGRIVALTAGRVRVALLEPAGKVVEVARITDPGGWSPQGCVRLHRSAA